MLEKMLAGLDISGDGVKIYMHILHHGTCTAGELSKKTGMPRATLYGILQKLSDKGIINKTLKYGIRSFSAAPPEKLGQMFQEKIEHLQNQHQAYIKLIPELSKNIGLGSLTPRFQYYEGREGVQHVLKDMLMYHDAETLALWPIKSMMEILSDGFFRGHNKQRIKNNLFTRAIWPAEEAVDIDKFPFLGVGPDFRREIRIAPAHMHFTMGYWIYKNKVAFLSSRAETFGFIIESQEMVDMLRVQFEVIWGMSKQINIDTANTRAFIADINKRPR